MAKQIHNLVLLLLVTALVTGTCAQEEQNPPSNSTANSRQGKVFSLFNIVQFKNSGCRSTSTISGGGTTSSYRNGTCFTSSECQTKGGTAAGNCAAGFGVCCVFLVTASGSTISQNCTYIRNPGYPSTYSSTSAVSYTINKACPMYVDVGAVNSDAATLGFNFASSSTTRQWEIKVTQVPCGGRATPPTGCLQYETGLTGRFSTFNFIPTTQSHLGSQQYSVCIRQELGYCCIQYFPCSDPNSFSINLKGMGGADFSAGVDTWCDSTDYIGIASSRATCSSGAGTAGPISSRYCGGALSTSYMSLTSQPICSCTQPFKVNIYTDAGLKLAAIAAATKADSNRGVCLTWKQIPCSSS